MRVCILADKDDDITVPGAVYGSYPSVAYLEEGAVDIIDEGWYIEVETLEQLMALIRKVGASIAYGYQTDNEGVVHMTQHPYLLLHDED